MALFVVENSQNLAFRLEPGAQVLWPFVYHQMDCEDYGIDTPLRNQYSQLLALKFSITKIS
jgi:hypothetical protein